MFLKTQILKPTVEKAENNELAEQGTSRYGGEGREGLSEIPFKY